MFENFTDRARRVMVLADQEARRFNHEYIGTEHVLLGIIEEGSGLGAQILQSIMFISPQYHRSLLWGQSVNIKPLKNEN